MEQPLGSFRAFAAGIEGEHLALAALLLVGFTLLLNQGAAWGKHLARNLLVPKH